MRDEGEELVTMVLIVCFCRRWERPWRQGFDFKKAIRHCIIGGEVVFVIRCSVFLNLMSKLVCAVAITTGKDKQEPPVPVIYV